MKHINPFTGEEKNIVVEDISFIEEKVCLAKKIGKIWTNVSFEERISIFSKISKLAKEREEEIAKTITYEMGKPFALAKAEVKRFSEYIDFYTANLSSVLAEEKLNGGIQIYQPLGVVAVISPWNFPLGVPISGIIPALLAGNAVIFKPSEYTTQTGQLIVDTFNSVPEFPKDLIQILIGEKEHGKELVKSNINMIHFTGSTEAGKHIMAEAAKGVKRVLLELGGMDASLVLEDADLRHAASTVVSNNISNSGQVCCAVKRVYVHENVYDEFVKLAEEKIKSLTIGDPEKEVDMGPLVAKFQKEKLLKIREDARNKGAKIISKSCNFTNSDNFFEPTLILNPTDDMKVLSTEPFGPMLPIMKFKDTKEAVKLANDSQYGLSASIFSKDTEKAILLAKEIEAGSVSINNHSGPPLGSPFGGFKESGIGFVRSKETLKQFCNVQFIKAY